MTEQWCKDLVESLPASGESWRTIGWAAAALGFDRDGWSFGIRTDEENREIDRGYREIARWTAGSRESLARSLNRVYTNRVAKGLIHASGTADEADIYDQGLP